MPARRPHVASAACWLAALLAVLSYTVLASNPSTTAPQPGQLLDTIASIDQCLLSSVNSFVYPGHELPDNLAELRRQCDSQAAAFKCLKDKNKALSGITKRGVAAFVQTRQRYNRKHCQNLDSPEARRLVADFKCILEKRLEAMRAADARLVNSFNEILRRNYNDSAPELKYLCCGLHEYRRALVDGVDPDCSSAKHTIEEFVESQVSRELQLVCDDDEKLATKVCPSLKPLKVASTLEGRNSSLTMAGLALYLFQTLGEADPTRPSFQEAPAG